MSVRDARVYTCKRVLYTICTVHDKLSCTRLQNYTIGASIMSVLVSVLVSVPWISSLNKLNENCRISNPQRMHVLGAIGFSLKLRLQRAIFGL